MVRSMKPEAAWGAVQLGFAEILDLRTGIERRRHGAPPGARPVSLAKHIASPEGPGGHLPLPTRHPLEGDTAPRGGPGRGRLRGVEGGWPSSRGGRLAGAAGVGGNSRFWTGASSLGRP